MGARRNRARTAAGCQVTHRDPTLPNGRRGRSPHRRHGDPLPDAYWSAFEAIDRDPDNRLIVAEDDGELVGTLQLTFVPYLTFQGGWRAQIEAVRIAVNRRGQGLGRALSEWAIAEAEQRGCHLVQLTTDKCRDDARQFYESLGFEATHEGMKLYLSGSATG